MAGPCKATAKAGYAAGTIAKSGAAARRCTSRSIRRGIFIALTVTPANEQERAQVDTLCQRVQQAKSDTVRNDIELQVVKLSEAKKDFVLLPKHCVVAA